MRFTFSNCKNIVSGEISVEENKLNIRYGSNGTGKTAISISIQSLFNDDLREQLIPYSDINLVPEVISTPTAPNSIKVFNEEYINKFLFKESNVLEEERVYEVLINDENLEEKKKELLDLFESLINLVSDINIQNFITKVNTIGSSIQLNASGTAIKGTSKAYKALKDGNRFISENIPELLEGYRSLLVGADKLKWIDWFNKGHSYSVECPYCIQVLPENFNEIKALIMSNYKKADVQNATQFLNSLPNNIDYLNEENNSLIINKFSDVDNLVANDTELVNLFKKLYAIKVVLESFKSLSVYDLLDETKTEELFDKFILVKNDANFISNENLIEIFINIETNIEHVRSIRTDYLRQKGIFNSALRRNVSISQQRINEFMCTAGIPYQVEIVKSDTTNPKLILKHTSQNTVNNILNGLSYGERNAFALMMFMMDVASENPDLIILDDPISSFDENKKYAILHSMFLNDNVNNLKNRTVLMLTHDFTPIIDLVRLKRYSFVDAKYIKSVNGILNEYPITKDDVKSVIEVARGAFNDSDRTVISRLINYRRFLELTNDSEDLKYQMISSLLKLKQNSSIMLDRNSFQVFTETEKIDTINDITQIFDNFDYDTMLNSFNNKEDLISAYDLASSYEKINIIRILKLLVNEGIGDGVIQKFIDESYHIENTMTFQLDPNSFDNIPSYIITACDEYVNRHR